METSIEHMEARTSAACDHAAAKWAALVNDVVVPMPRREVTTELIKAQASVDADFVLVRDHNSPDDVVLAETETIDLGQGNVFYTLRSCDVRPRGHCSSPPKYAFFIDDRSEITTRAVQSGKTLRDLFALSPRVKLVRDLDGPLDEDIALDDVAPFANGPVFYTRAAALGLAITVNSRVFGTADGVKAQMTGREIAKLVYPEAPGDTRIWEVSAGNREIGLDQITAIEGCEVFDVVRCNVTGGYEASRIERELGQLRDGGLVVTLLTEPVASVVYHGLRGMLGGQQMVTDVLVQVPSAYPGQFIDYAYLPEGSAFIGRVPGSPQEPRIHALGKIWQQISYHPHNGGGGPAWNPGLHGFHTYLGELQSWLRTS